MKLFYGRAHVYEIETIGKTHDQRRDSLCYFLREYGEDVLRDSVKLHLTVSDPLRSAFSRTIANNRRSLAKQGQHHFKSTSPPPVVSELEDDVVGWVHKYTRRIWYYYEEQLKIIATVTGHSAWVGDVLMLQDWWKLDRVSALERVCAFIEARCELRRECSILWAISEVDKIDTPYPLITYEAFRAEFMRQSQGLGVFSQLYADGGF